MTHPAPHDSPSTRDPSERIGPPALLGRNDVLSLPDSTSYAVIPEIRGAPIGKADLTLEAWFRSQHGGPLLALREGVDDALEVEIERDGNIVAKSRGEIL